MLQQKSTLLTNEQVSKPSKKALKGAQKEAKGPKEKGGENPHLSKWYLVDAKDQVVGRLATILARLITGKHKAAYTKHIDSGDFVVVTNCDKVVFTRNKWDKKMYYDYSGYLSGLKAKTARELLARKPDDILWRAVWGMTGKSSLARKQMKKLKLFVSDKHTHAAQNPQPLPKGLVRNTVLDPKRQVKA